MSSAGRGPPGGPSRRGGAPPGPGPGAPERESTGFFDNLIGGSNGLGLGVFAPGSADPHSANSIVAMPGAGAGAGGIVAGPPGANPNSNSKMPSIVATPGGTSVGGLGGPPVGVGAPPSST